MSSTSAVAGRLQSSPRSLVRLKLGDEAAYWLCLLFALAIVVLTIALAYELYRGSAEARHDFGWHFLLSKDWDPVAGNFGALPFVYGTVVTSLVALTIAIPVGIGASIFLSELAPRAISDALTYVIELLAAVPSVIYGLLGIFVLIPLLLSMQPHLARVLDWFPLFKGPFYGVSYFTAGLVLAIMILPFIVSVCREVLLAVPREQREAMLALGATRWEVARRAVLPYARRGVIGSIFLALARALGETMAVTMVVGNVVQISPSLLAPGYTIAAVVANEFTEATGNLYLSALIELGLVLFAVTILINGLARLLVLATAAKAHAL